MSGDVCSRPAEDLAFLEPYLEIEQAHMEHRLTVVMKIAALDDYCLSSIAVSDGQIFLRTSRHLWVIGETR